MHINKFLKDNNINRFVGMRSWGKCLFLDGTGITEISGFIVPDIIDILHLDDNQITSIDDFDAKNLKHLHLTGNQITSIDNFDVKDLETFHISENPIKEIRSFDPKNLETMWISDIWELEYISPEVFEKIECILEDWGNIRGTWKKKIFPKK